MKKQKINKSINNKNNCSIDKSAEYKMHLLQQTKDFINGLDNKPKIILDHQNIQIIAYINFLSPKSSRYLALSRTDGVPFLIRIKDECLYGTVLEWTMFKELLCKIDELLRVPHGVIISLYHHFSMKDLLKINSETWQSYVVPLKKCYPLFNIPVSDNTLYNCNVKDLLSSSKFGAEYNGKQYDLSTTSVYDIQDYILPLYIKGKNKLVDIRDLQDIFEKEFYAEIKGTLFKIELLGKNSIILQCKSFEEEKSFGFKWLDPKDIGPGWEVSLSQINSVKFKKKSIYSATLHRLKII